MSDVVHTCWKSSARFDRGATDCSVRRLLWTLMSLTRGHGIHNSKERGKSNIQATHCGKKAAAFWICNQQKCERARDQVGKYYIILNIYDILKATAETFTESKFDMN